MAGPFAVDWLTEDCELTAADWELTAEDFEPTASANRRLTADWDTNCGVRTKLYKLATFHWSPQLPVVEPDVRSSVWSKSLSGKSAVRS
jgi:hypothetical protein